MGLTFLTVEIGNTATLEATEKVEFLIDSGAIFAVVPTPILDKLGIKPIKTREFRLANGENISRKTGFAFFKYRDNTGVSEVIFGEEGDSALLGALTLEALGLALNPLKRELYPIPMMLAAEQISEIRNAPDAMPNGQK